MLLSCFRKRMSLTHSPRATRRRRWQRRRSRRRRSCPSKSWAQCRRTRSSSQLSEKNASRYYHIIFLLSDDNSGCDRRERTVRSALNGLSVHFYHTYSWFSFFPGKRSTYCPSLSVVESASQQSENRIFQKKFKGLTDDSKVSNSLTGL